MTSQATDKSSALCHRDGRVSITYHMRDVPVRNTAVVVKHIRVGVCDTCGDTIVIPAAATHAIAQALADNVAQLSLEGQMKLAQALGQAAEPTEALKQLMDLPDFPETSSTDA